MEHNQVNKVHHGTLWTTLSEKPLILKKNNEVKVFRTHLLEPPPRCPSLCTLCGCYWCCQRCSQRGTRKKIKQRGEKCEHRSSVRVKSSSQVTGRSQKLSTARTDGAVSADWYWTKKLSTNSQTLNFSPHASLSKGSSSEWILYIHIFCEYYVKTAFFKIHGKLNDDAKKASSITI